MSGDYDATHYGLAISSVLIAVTGIGSNSLSLSYFIAQLGSTAVPQVRKNCTTSRLFMVLNVFDLRLCVYSTLMIIIWVEVLDLGFTTVFKCFCVVYQVLLINLTSFITCVMAVIRATDLLFPFDGKRGRRTATYVSIFVYSILTFSLAALEMLHVSERKLSNDVTQVVLSLIAANMTGIFVIIIISNMICMIKLYFSASQRIAHETRHATVTVGILSLIYCLCNAGFIYDRVSYATTLVLPGHIHSIVFHSILLPLNSACNPVVYFTRKADMRLHLTKLWRKTKKSLCSGGTHTEQIDEYTASVLVTKQ